MHLFFSKMKVLLNIKKKKYNQLLSKSTLKYLVYYQVFLAYKTNAYLYGHWCFITAFSITCQIKKLQCKCNNINKVFPNMFSNKTNFLMQQSKSKKNSFSFFFFQCFNFHFFRWSGSFLRILFFSFLRRALCSTWKKFNFK